MMFKNRVNSSGELTLAIAKWIFATLSNSWAVIGTYRRPRGLFDGLGFAETIRVKFLILFLMANLVAANSVLAGAVGEPLSDRPVNQVQKVLDLLNNKSSEADFIDQNLKPDQRDVQRIGEVDPKNHGVSAPFTANQGAFTTQDAASERGNPGDAATSGVR